MRILFACVGNAARSQMAEAFCRELGRDIECASAGTGPARALMPETIAVMDEVGLDLSAARPRGFANLPPARFDIIVAMGRDVVPPFLPCDKLVKWRIPDPLGRDIGFYRRVRDRIHKQVRDLLDSLGRLRPDETRDR
ncbi:hypothetical protein JXB37_00720 [candidate division WOR-3 bacterium]|nr:hypothetical protein [candidate division WOR-3 bacterium]